MVAPIISEETRLMTLAEFLRHENQRIEIIGGETVEMTAAGMVHQAIARNAFRALDQFCLANPIGEVFQDQTTYLMFSTERGLKNAFLPDVSFIRNESIMPLDDPKRPYPGAPDLAVEVISPSDNSDDVLKKVRIYFGKGTDEVWLVFPETREVHQFRRDTPDTARIYTGEQVIETPMLAGFTLPLTQIFALPEWMQKQQRGGSEE
jgi:Uma2 family endonuclease